MMINMDFHTVFNRYLKPYAPNVLRLSLALVFLYFGVVQLQRPEGFIGWLPSEASLIPLEPRTLIVLNGAFEIVAGVCMFIGIYTRWATLLLGLHLSAITLSIGFTEIGVRDFGLSMAALASAMHGPDSWCLETYTSERRQPPSPNSNTKKISPNNTL